MKTQCQTSHHNHRLLLAEEHLRFRDEINRIARGEFPAGTRVAWRPPNHKLDMEGEVTGHMAGETGMVTVKSDGGSGFTLRAWELEALP